MATTQLAKTLINSQHFESGNADPQWQSLSLAEWQRCRLQMISLNLQSTFWSDASNSTI
jgi:hypothetical protein